MERKPSPTAPQELQPLFIEEYLARANQLARICFAAQGLDGALRTEAGHDATEHSADVLHVGRGRLLRGEG